MINKSTNQQTQWAGARPKDNRTAPLAIPPPPVEVATESELSEFSDDDNMNVDRRGDVSATDYDNMYSTDNNTYNSRIGPPYTRDKTPQYMSNKFVAKLEQMQLADCNIKELYSEIESDAADCESLVGDTDYETETNMPTGNSTRHESHDYNHPLQKLQWAENKLLALLKPSNNTGGNVSTMGSTLRHCRSMELLPCEGDETTDKRRHSQRWLHGSRNSQLLDDNISITSSMLGSEFSRSDPYLSDVGAYESEYDNYGPGLNRGTDEFLNHNIESIDLNQFDHIDFDKIKIGENLTTQDYIQSLQQHIELQERKKSKIIPAQSSTQV